MSNMIALVSLDFGGAGSMCGIGRGVDADGRALARALRLCGEVWLEIGTQWGLHTHAKTSESDNA